MAYSEIISILKDVILAGTAITAVIVAFKGLKTWEHQLKGKSEYELSRRILVTLFKYRDAINGVRHPAMYAYELSYPPEDKARNMSSEQINYYGTSKAYRTRSEKVQNEKISLYADLLESEAIWGIDLKNIFKGIYKLENELFSQIQNYLELINPNTLDVRKQHIQKITNNNQDIMYDTLANDDEFRNNMTSEIKKIEKYLKPKLSHEKL